MTMFNGKKSLNMKLKDNKIKETTDRMKFLYVVYHAQRLK